MRSKLIAIENRSGPFRMILKRVMRMVPDKDKRDKRLQRLLAFRLINDGEEATAAYLIRHIRHFVHQPPPKSFYEFLIEGQKRGFPPATTPTDGGPPGAA